MTITSQTPAEGADEYKLMAAKRNEVHDRYNALNITADDAGPRGGRLQVDALDPLSRSPRLLEMETTSSKRRTLPFFFLQTADSEAHAGQPNGDASVGAASRLE